MMRLFFDFQSFNPMSEPFDDWGCKFDLSQEQRRMDSEDFSGLAIDSTDGTGNKDFTVPCEAAGEDDDEVTETKIQAFLDEKVCYNLIFFEISSLYKNICVSSPVCAIM